MRYGSDQPEAPTHLGSHQLPLSPEWLDEDGGDPPTRAARGSELPFIPEPLPPLPARVVTERSVARHPIVAPPRAPRAEAPRAPEPPVLPKRDRDRDRRDLANKESSKRPSTKSAAAPAGPLPRERSTSSSSSSSHEAPAPSTEQKSKSSGSLPRESSRQIEKPVEKKSEAASKSKSRSAAPEAPQRPSATQAQRMAQLQQMQAMAAAQAQAAAAGGDPVAALAAMGALDPLQMPVPPALGAPIYGWVRRLALQADLAGADRVLRDAMLELTQSLHVVIVYPGQDGLWSLGPDDEIPKDPAPLIAVAQARRAIISSHTAIVPILTSTDTVGVVLCTRNPRNQGFHPMEQIAMVALAREAAAILHHLAVAHLQKQSEIAADQGGLYRGEALEAHRSRGTEGQVIQLTPGWVKIAYYVLVVTLIVGVALGTIVHVPTYSTGSGVVYFEGIGAVPSVQGNIEQIYVGPGTKVKKGDLLLKLRSENEDAELRAAQTEFERLTETYLFDQSDQAVRQQLASAGTRVEKARESVKLRYIRAKKDGVISDLRAKVGSVVNPGENLATIVDEGQEPEFYAILPGSDRPRLQKDMTLWINLDGYKKAREEAIITYVGNEIIGSQEVGKYIGQTLADSLKLPQGSSWVIVKAKLPAKTFVADHKTYRYHHGMPASIAEVRVTNKPFLVTLIPAIEKYWPD